jgi:hypothetical protein
MTQCRCAGAARWPRRDLVDVVEEITLIAPLRIGDNG